MSLDFRLPGFGGAAIFLRRHVVWDGDIDDAREAFDIGLLSPGQRTEYYARPAGEGFPSSLAGFLFRAASEFHPELSLPIFTDLDLGFTLSAMSSTDDRVELQVSVLRDLDDDDPDTDEMNFATSRAVLVSASQDAARLDPSLPAGVDGGELF